MIKEEIEVLLNNAAVKAGYGEVNLTVSFSALPQVCDFQSNGCFALAKKLGKAPLEIAENIVNNIENNDKFEFFALKPAFINVKVTNMYLSKTAENILNDKNLGVEKIDNKKVLIDYGGPNIGKAMHIGHMRSFNIGEAMKRLYRKLGFTVVSDIFLGDWGMPLGLIIAQLEDEGVLEYYFKGKGSKPTLTLEMMNVAYPKASLRKAEEPDFKAKAEDYTLRFQRGEQPYYGIWQELRAVSVEAVKKTSHKLNADFDLWNGESTASPYFDEVIKLFKDKGLARVSDGALIVDVAEEGEQIPIPKKTPDEPQRYENPMPPIILQKSNGGEMYSTYDIATIYYRNKLYKPDILHYIADNRQSQHFTQVFRACKKAGFAPETLIHTGFGTMNGKDGKPFKTREGGTLKLEEFLGSIQDKAKEKLAANNVDASEDISLKIAIGALKFGDLSTSVEKDYVFDVDKFLAFEGKTGPYIQYTICRIKSILAKANEEGGAIAIDSVEERNIVLSLLKLISSYRICYEDKSLSSLCLACYDLASNFSAFYNACHILSEQNEAKRKSYLSLLVLVKKVLKNALDTLAIEVPEKM